MFKLFQIWHFDKNNNKTNKYISTITKNIDLCQYDFQTYLNNGIKYINTKIIIFKKDETDFDNKLLNLQIFEGLAFKFCDLQYFKDFIDMWIKLVISYKKIKSDNLIIN